MAQVLLTGGTGFLASHILDILIDHGFLTVVTVRSEEKGQRILDALPPASKSKVSYVVVPDIVQPGAFDHALSLHAPTLKHIIHTASPYHFNITDPVNDIIAPAVVGTLNLLHSIPVHAPNVKRVVLTSSSATILNPGSHPKIYDESVYGKATWTQGMNARSCYRVGKILAERASLSFLTSTSPKPSFSISTINPPLLFGPPPAHLPSLASLNTSNARILSALNKEPLGPTGPVYIFCDVRDAALAHVRVLEVEDREQVNGERFFVVGGWFSNRGIERVVGGMGEGGVGDGEDDVPPENQRYGFDNSKSKRVLGMQYRRFEECIRDTVEGIRGLEGRP